MHGRVGRADLAHGAVDGAPAGPARRGPRSTAPNAPNSTFVIERFIARPIICVSNVPLAPTSVPETISTFECSTKPVAAAARPVQRCSAAR